MINPEEFAIGLRRKIVPLSESLGHKVNHRNQAVAIHGVLREMADLGPDLQLQKRSREYSVAALGG